MEDGNLGGATVYLCYKCTAPWPGSGVELDWARQFWDFRTDAGNRPNDWVILEQTKLGFPNNGWNNTNAWEKMGAGVWAYDFNYGTNFFARWDNLDDSNGIDVSVCD